MVQPAVPMRMRALTPPQRPGRAARSSIAGAVALAGRLRSAVGAPQHMLAQSRGEREQDLLQVLGEAQIGVEQLARAAAQPIALHPLASEDVDDVDLGAGEPGEIIGAKLAAVILVQALLRHVGADEQGELRLLEAESLPLLGKPRSETHWF